MTSKLAKMIAALLVTTSAAHAALPPLPPMTNGDGNPVNNGMKHALVSRSGAQLSVHQADPPASPVTMISGFGIDYDPTFDVLENRWFNSQHGWLPEGIWVPPAGAEVWIRRTGLTAPQGATLRVYEGGMGNVMPSWSVNEIHVNNGDIWLWDRVMQHDLFVADKPGRYAMSFDVYLGDATTGEPLPNFDAASTTLEFLAPVPEPAVLLLSLSALLCLCAIRLRG